MADGVLRVPHPDVTRVVQAIQYRSAEAEQSGKGQMLMVLGPSGWGKTSLCTSRCAATPPQFLPTKTVVRRLYMDIPLDPRPATMNEALAVALGHKLTKKGSDDQLADLHHLMKACESKEILIDNVQDIVRKRGQIGLLDCAAWIRKVHDGFPGVVVLFGTKLAEQVVAQEPQLRRRGPATLRCGYLSVATMKDLARSMRFVHEIDMRLPLAEESNLKQWTREVVWGSYGVPDYIFKICSFGVMSAVRDGRERLIRADLEFGFDRVHEDAGLTLNPFREGGPRRHLDQPGEPFHRWDQLQDLPLRMPRRRSSEGKD